MLSDSPPEKDIQWSETGMNSSFKYIQKFCHKMKNLFNFKNNKVSSNKEIDVFVNQAIAKINFALEKFRYNVIIAIFHEIYSFLNKILETNTNYRILKKIIKKF